MSVLVNHELLKKVLEVHEPIENDDDSEIWKRGLTKMEQIRLTKVANMCDELTDMDFAVIVIIALKRYPGVVMKAILQQLQEGKDATDY